MILEITAKGAITPAETLLEKNIVLEPIPDTVISQLTTASNQLVNDEVSHEYSEKESLDGFIDLITYATVDSAQGPSPHSEILGEVKDKLIDIVNNHINIARNTVKPIVEEMSSGLETFIEAQKTKDPSLEFSIVIKKMPEVLKSSLLIDDISKYDGIKPLVPSSSLLDLEDKTAEDIIKDILTGSNSLDVLITEVITELGNDEIVRIYKSYFTKDDVDNLLTPDELSKLTAFDRCSYMLIVYLLAKKYLNATQTNKQSIDLINYQRAMVEIRDYSGAVVFTSMKNIERAINTKQLLLRVENAGKTAIMNGELYTEWLKSGGKPEYILGALVYGKTYASVMDIDRNIETYKKVWDSYLIFKKTSDNNRLLKVYKDYIFNLFYTMIKELSDIELEYIESHPNYRQNVDKLLEEYISGLGFKDIDNYEEVALICIAKIRFYYTSSYKILSDIQKAYNVNPDVDVRQAALLAVINYITDYVMDQVAVSSCL